MEIKKNDKVEFIVKSKTHQSTHSSFASAAGTLEALKYQGEVVRIQVSVTGEYFKWLATSHKFNPETNNREIVNKTAINLINTREV